jgi:predicted Zn-dependent protease
MTAFFRAALALFVSLALCVQPAAAQSVLRDAETEALFRDISGPLVSAAGLQPGQVDIVLVGDKEINAFVAGGQVVYIHSGLIMAADNVNQVQGVIAHELGHIAGGHVIRFGDGMKAATGITILSLLLGAAAVAAGAGEAAMGILGAGQQAAMGTFLSFTRNQESSADQAGARYLEIAGVSGRGSIEFFKKLQNQEFRLAIPQDDGYARTHPLSGDRIAALEHTYRSSKNWDVKIDPSLEARFERVKAKLMGFTEEPNRVLARYPESDQSIPARYARAYAWHRGAYPDRAVGEVEKLSAALPHDPYFLELKGQILLESGRPKDAIPALREAVAIDPNPLISVLLGHALIATEDVKNFDEARRVLKVAVQRDRENPFAWYQLGIIYDREGDQPRAALATAERYSLEGRNALALGSAEFAARTLPAGTPDSIRAQDLALTARVAMDEKNKK